jgi:hypothetical protein
MNHAATVKTKIQKLPIIGHITIPIHLMGDTDGFHSGFAFWKVADCASEVYEDDAEGNEVQLGKIGATMGGHTEARMNDLSVETPDTCAKGTTLMLDAVEMWQAIATVFDSAEGQEQLKLINAKYREDQDAEELEKLEKEIAELEATEAALTNA